jgi:hypothetical protein
MPGGQPAKENEQDDGLKGGGGASFVAHFRSTSDCAIALL